MKGDWRREGCIKGGAKSTAGGKGGREAGDPLHKLHYRFNTIPRLKTGTESR